MQVLRYFCPPGSFYRIAGCRNLVGGPLPTLWRKPRCRKYPPSRTPCYCRRLRILAAPLSSRPSAPSLYCPAPAGTYGKCYGSSIISAVRVCRLGYLLGAKLEKTQRTSSLVSDCVWF